jgi:hypothetical protein
MSFMNTMKCVLNPRAEGEKRRKNLTLFCRSQFMKVYVRGIAKPLDKVYSRKDVCMGDWTFRYAKEDSFNSDFTEWLHN